MSAYLLNTYHRLRIPESTLQKLHTAATLISRGYVAQVFFSAGLTKLRDWDSTLFLFEEEYHVPLLPYEFAAYLSTFSELLLPLLLVVGLFTRLSALALLLFNFVAVISLAEMAPAALYLHVIWGVLLLHLTIYGGGAVSTDRFLEKLNRNNPPAQSS